MNAGQITMPKAEARRRIALYRASKYSETDAEYRAAITAYRALAKGTPIIVLSQSLALAPLDEKRRPRMAIARADEQEVHMSSHNGLRAFQPVGRWRLHWRARESRTVRVTDPRSSVSGVDGYAMVPMVPPDVRGDRKLEDHWILWEVEQWADAPRTIRPDRDPLLLKRLAGEMYAVVGQWDLTDVERAIMAGTRAHA